MSKPYLHELTKEEYQEFVRAKLTRKQMLNLYEQPEWCTMPEAAAGILGCWSLVLGKVKKESDCDICDCSKNYKEATNE